MNNEEELYQMLAELRRRQLVALKADNAVLEQHLAIWNEYQVYVINERRGLSKRPEPSAPVHVVDLVNGDGRMPNSMVEAVDRAVNGDALSIDQIVLAVEARFPKMAVHPKAAYRALWTLVKKEKFTKTKSGKKFIYTRAMWLLLLIPFLFGCRTSIPKPTPDPIPSAIIPRWMPGAPSTLDPRLWVDPRPTTVSRSLSWTHSPMPGLKTYRVDYGNNSRITATNNCILRLDPKQESNFHFHIRGSNGKRYFELANLNLLVAPITSRAAPPTPPRIVTLMFDPANDPTVVGYRIYYRNEAGLTNSTDVGNVNMGFVGVVPGESYKFWAKSYNAAGVESVPSNEVSYTVPAGENTAVIVLWTGPSAQGPWPVALATNRVPATNVQAYFNQTISLE